MDISFVIPCYRSSASLPTVVEQIESVVDRLDVSSHEIVLVNDCSPDGGATWETIRQLCAENPHIKGVNLAKNSGQGGATMAGLRNAQGELIVVGDDDGQTPYDYVVDMVDKLEREDRDIVCANYTSRGKRSFIRSFGSWVNVKMTYWTLEIPQDVMVSVFFTARRYIVDEILRYHNPYPYLLGLITQTTHNIGNIEVEQRERLNGSSGYTFSKLLSMWMNGLTAFSIKPLRLTSFFGFLCAGIGFITGLITIIRKLCNPGILAGYSSLLSVILLVGGILMLMLGLIGEYLGRIYICINDRPQYVVKEVIGSVREEVAVR